MNADAIAGNINFIMKDAPNKTLFNFKIYTGYSKNQTSDFPIDQIGTFGQSKGALTIGDLFMDGKFGYSVTGTWEKRTKSEYTERWDWDFDDDQLEDGPYEKLDGTPTDVGERYYRQAPTETEEFIGGVNTALLWKPVLWETNIQQRSIILFMISKILTLNYVIIMKMKRSKRSNDVKLEPKHVLQVACRRTEFIQRLESGLYPNLQQWNRPGIAPCSVEFFNRL